MKNRVQGSGFRVQGHRAITVGVALICAILYLPSSILVPRAFADVVQFGTGDLTASTNASATAVYTNKDNGDGTIRRVVINLSAGLTNVDVSLVDWDGTALLSTNSIGAGTNTAASVTLTSGAGLLPSHWFIVKTANAQKFSTNNAGTLTLTVTQDR